MENEKNKEEQLKELRTIEQQKRDNEFVISSDVWIFNRSEFAKMINNSPKFLKKRKTKAQNDASYVDWIFVHKWMKITYPDNVFITKEINLADNGNAGYIRGQLLINNKIMGELCLNLESMWSEKNKKWINETPEQLQLRVYVKLVANVTGFGINLWEK